MMPAHAIIIIIIFLYYFYCSVGNFLSDRLYYTKLNNFTAATSSNNFVYIHQEAISFILLAIGRKFGINQKVKGMKIDGQGQVYSQKLINKLIK